LCYSERTRQLQDTQKREQKAAKELKFSRNNPDDTLSHSDKQERDNNSEDKVLFITNTNATKFTRITLFQGLPYFTNYHIHDHKITSSTPRLCRFAAARQGVFIGQRSGVHRTSVPTTKDSKK
jgi:hypothetical protein